MCLPLPATWNKFCAILSVAISNNSNILLCLLFFFFFWQLWYFKEKLYYSLRLLYRCHLPVVVLLVWACGLMLYICICCDVSHPLQRVLFICTCEPTCEVKYTLLQFAVSLKIYMWSKCRWCLFFSSVAIGRQVNYDVAPTHFPTKYSICFRASVSSGRSCSEGGYMSAQWAVPLM